MYLNVALPISFQTVFKINVREEIAPQGYSTRLHYVVGHESTVSLPRVVGRQPL